MKPFLQHDVRAAVVLVAALLSLHARAGGGGLSLATENSRYLAWHGKPLLVVGSGEHYGAVLNADFDTARYLSTLRRDGMNHTRLFTGAAYVEPAGAFNIERNTLAPRAERYLAPWARSGQPGYRGGGNRFDLDHWDEAYFRRLRRFVADASRKRVIVEVNLFCPFYGDEQWVLSPFHPDNNINGAGRDVSRTNVYTLPAHGGLLKYQESFVRRVVADLEPADNIYYEICNEPYFGGVTLEWQAHIARVITEAQSGHRRPKLISQNIANQHATVTEPLPHVSIFNFHYASPPQAVALNRHLHRPIGDNETGFAGTNDRPYRVEAWNFLLAGGALFSHLDYSFTCGFEDGTFAYPKTQPGGGNATLRSQFRNARAFLEKSDFVRLAPDTRTVEGPREPGYSVHALSRPDHEVVAYLHGAAPDPAKPAAAKSVHLRLRVPAGRWQVEWVEPATGRTLNRLRASADGSGLELTSPLFADDLAFRATRSR